MKANKYTYMESRNKKLRPDIYTLSMINGFLYLQFKSCLNLFTKHFLLLNFYCKFSGMIIVYKLRKQQPNITYKTVQYEIKILLEKQHNLQHITTL